MSPDHLFVNSCLILSGHPPLCQHIAARSAECVLMRSMTADPCYDRCLFLDYRLSVSVPARAFIRASISYPLPTVCESCADPCYHQVSAPQRFFVPVDGAGRVYHRPPLSCIGRGWARRPARGTPWRPLGTQLILWYISHNILIILYATNVLICFVPFVYGSFVCVLFRSFFGAQIYAKPVPVLV